MINLRFSPFHHTLPSAFIVGGHGIEGFCSTISYGSGETAWKGLLVLAFAGDSVFS